VAIARSLCVTPEIMLFDVMVELAQEGMTMVCVTHEMVGFARTVGDTIVFMGFGEIVEREPPQELFANSKGSRTKLSLSQILAH
jgi:ABC-type polar amino acid transport system ATPase subunit